MIHHFQLILHCAMHIIMNDYTISLGNLPLYLPNFLPIFPALCFLLKLNLCQQLVTGQATHVQGVEL